MFFKRKLIAQINEQTAKINEHLNTIENKLDPILIKHFYPSHYFGHEYQSFGPYTYAQHGEDLIFLNIFKILGIEKPTYIDIGAHDPIVISNTALLYKRGCRGINIEANPFLIEKFKQERPDDINLNIGISDTEGILDFYMIDSQSPVNTFDKSIAEKTVQERPHLKINEIRKIKVLTLQQIIDEYSHSKFPDLLTIDIEGFDYKVLKSADFQTTYPKVICVEVNDQEFPRMVSLMKSRSFLPYIRTISNTIFLHESCIRIIFRN